MKARHEFDSDLGYRQYLRTYLSALAMQAMLSNDTNLEALGQIATEDGISRTDALAIAVLDAADVIIEALNK